LSLCLLHHLFGSKSQTKKNCEKLSVYRIRKCVFNIILCFRCLNSEFVNVKIDDTQCKIIIKKLFEFSFGFSSDLVVLQEEIDRMKQEILATDFVVDRVESEAAKVVDSKSVDSKSVDETTVDSDIFQVSYRK
jgi:hypothetical protein